MKKWEYRKRNLWVLSHIKKHEAEHLRSLDEIGKILVKTAVLINGGGALALLAFIGSAMSAELDRYVVISLTLALHTFAWGVISAASCLLSSYITSLLNYSAYIDADITDTFIGEVVFIDFKILKLKAKIVLPFFYLLTFALLLFSFFSFVDGINETTDAFFEHFVSELDTLDTNGV